MSVSEPESAVSALALDDVSVVRGGKLIWSEGTFEVPAGGIVAIIGSNGSGKTSLLKLILGLIPAASGRVQVLGKSPGEVNEFIGYVPQNYASASGEAIRVCDAILLGLNGTRWAFGRPTREERRRVAEVLDAVDAGPLALRRLSELSGGQRQRVAIAEALVADPKMLILDEPLASLDLRNQREIVQLLDRLNKDLGVTIMVVAHDLNPLLGVLNSAIYLLDGHAHFDTLDDVVDESLLSHLYGTPIQVVRTPQGVLYMRSTG
jgi:zinc/manganese transport system ATP-binding protein